MSTTPSGPPPSGPPKGPPSGPPKGPPKGPPAGPPKGPPSGSRPPGTAATTQGPNRNQLTAGIVVVALLLGGLGVAVASGGGDDKAATGKKERTIKLEPISSIGEDEFTPPLSPDTTSTPPDTLVPPPPGNTPFGGTGDNTLCDRESLISFLTANSAQASEWARVVGISVSDIPTYVRGLIPTTLRYDTRVTNHTFVNGRAVPLQSVLQAGTAVLVDEYGKLVARCRCGNPLLEPTKISDPIYSGPKWPGFDPGTIIVIVISETPVYPPGGVVQPNVVDIRVNATGNNIRGTQDSTTDVVWTGSFEVDGSSITGNGSGTVDFNGGCYNLSTGEKIADQHTAATFNVVISGSASGDRPDGSYSLTFTASNFVVTDFGVDACLDATNSQAFLSGTTEIFESQVLPAQDNVTELNRGEYQGLYLLCGRVGGVSTLRPIANVTPVPGRVPAGNPCSS